MQQFCFKKNGERQGYFRAYGYTWGMYTATMKYCFTPEGFERGCSLWKDTVMKSAASAPGMVRMQLLTADPKALAIGTWKTKADAEAFMRTGIFKALMERIEPLLERRPEPELWELSAYAEGRP